MPQVSALTQNNSKISVAAIEKSPLLPRGSSLVRWSSNCSSTWLLLERALGRKRFAWDFCVWLMLCAVSAFSFKCSACSYSCQGTFSHPQGLGWGQMGKRSCTEALSKCPRSPSGLVLSVHKTQNAIIYRRVYCKYCESKEMRKNTC